MNIYQEIRDILAHAPPATVGYGPGWAIGDNGQRIWICASCARRVSDRGMVGCFQRWAQPDSRDHGRQCIGGCMAWYEDRTATPGDRSPGAGPFGGTGDAVQPP